ncbi:MAG TPA: RecX family transcriptional regulator [Pyrinomonadaceae bacterium]|nr:RecX family transcriptional regulator [Pyrinomonadaceae bacterium]
MFKRPRKRKDETSGRNLTPEERRARTFQRAAKLLAAKPRSESELRERLLEGRYATKSVVDEVIARLREYGYLDDQQFALSFASHKVKQKPTGRRRLERDLMMKKVDRAVAGEALDKVFAETPEKELIDRAIEKRIRLRGRPGNRNEAKSLFDHLLRQGFAFDLVSDKVRAISAAATEDDE